MLAAALTYGAPLPGRAHDKQKPARMPERSHGHRGGLLAPVRIAGVDALYRETPDDVHRWLDLGIEAINKETPTLYAAAATCGLRSVWLGHVSDTLWLTTRAWDSWQRPAALTDVSTGSGAASRST